MAKTKQKQKQTQKQNVVQKVVVKLDSSGQKIKVKRKRLKRSKKEPEPEQSMLFDERYYRQLPAPVVYQSTTQVPLIVPSQGPAPAFNPPPQPQMINQPVPSTPFLEDLGLIGTEGPVEILDIPTKAEQLADFITPTALKIYSDEFSKSLDEKAKYFKSLQEPMRQPFFPTGNIKFQMEDINPDEIPVAEIVPRRTRRTKKEMAEAAQMLREDVASTGLAQFENTFQPKPFNFQEEASIVSGITQPMSEMPTTEIISNITTSFRRNTWGDLLQRYQNLTGTVFQRRKGYKKGDFQALVERMERES
jgi:hypothetical protein